MASVGALVRGHKCVVAVGSLNGAVAFARQLVALGAKAPFLVADTLGAGVAHRSAPFPHVLICQDQTAANQLEAFRNYRDTLARLPTPAGAALDAYDPSRVARPLVAAQHHVPTVAGRVTFTRRPTAWMQLEDKTAVDALWDRLEIPRAPSRVIELRRDLVATAANDLDEGAGTVLAGDSRQGYNSGGDYVRHVHRNTDVDNAYQFFAMRCTRIRVMPFLRGVPCSIHGLVFPEGVAVFRPVEMFILRPPNGSRFLYAGNGTYWDPPSSGRAEMRAAARRAGDHLRLQLRYRGGFTIDGVMTPDGFRPTELNPRAGAAFTTLSRGAEMPLWLIDMALRGGIGLDQTHDDLEDRVLRASDEHRTGTVWAMTQTRLPSDSQDWTLTRHSTIGGAVHVDIGPSQVGGVIQVRLGGTAATERPAAPEVADILCRADRELGTQFGPLRASADLETPAC